MMTRFSSYAKDWLPRIGWILCILIGVGVGQWNFSPSKYEEYSPIWFLRGWLLYFIGWLIFIIVAKNWRSKLISLSTHPLFKVFYAIGAFLWYLFCFGLVGYGFVDRNTPEFFISVLLLFIFVGIPTTLYWWWGFRRWSR